MSNTDPVKLASGLEAAKEELRETYRIKMNCDYSYTHKGLFHNCSIFEHYGMLA